MTTSGLTRSQRCAALVEELAEFAEGLSPFIEFEARSDRMLTHVYELARDLMMVIPVEHDAELERARDALRRVAKA